MCPILKFSQLKDVNLVLRPLWRGKWGVETLPSASQLGRGAGGGFGLACSYLCCQDSDLSLKPHSAPSSLQTCHFGQILISSSVKWACWWTCSEDDAVWLSTRVAINEPMSGRQCYGQQSPFIVGTVIFLPLQSLRRIWPSWLVSKRLKKAVGEELGLRNGTTHSQGRLTDPQGPKYRHSESSLL